MVSRSQLSRSLSGAAAALAALAVLSAAPARAATDAEQAEALIREGVKLRAADSAARALPLFEKAYQISRTPRTAAQLGLCEQELGYWVEAERYLGEALAAPDHPWIAKNKSSLKKALETVRANVGELALIVSPGGAEVSLNGKPLDKALLAAPIRLGKGPVDVEVRAPGHVPAREVVTIAGGKREQRTVTLVPEAPQPVAAVPAVVPTAADPNAPLMVGATSTPPPHRKKRLAAWITGGAAVGALVLGSVGAISAAGASDAFNSHTMVVNGTAYPDCGTTELSPACRSLKDDYDQALTLSIIGFAAAGALAATSATLFVLSRGGGEGGGARALACVPDPVARGLGCTLRF